MTSARPSDRRHPATIASSLVALLPFGLVVSACDPGTGPVDPGRHRASLRKLEIILYRPTLPEPEDRKAIEDAAAALAMEVGAGRGPRAREASRAIEAFSTKIGGRGEERFETVSLVETRAEWEELRGLHFAPAVWLSESTPFLEQAQGGPLSSGRPVPPPREAEPAPHVQFVLEQMSGIVDRAEVFLDGLGPCVDSGDYERAREAWDNWKRSHENDVALAKDSLDPRYANSFGNTFRDLLALAAPLKGGPCNSTLNNDNRVRVQRARGMLKRARESAARMRPAG